MATAVTIPETITVHLGTPQSGAANVTVSFPNYIKNVASSEIYPTWPREAILANIYAQISFTLNRVFTEWYRAQGYDFDITNSTAFDQSYVPGRDIFDNIGLLVDEVFNDYLVRGQNIEPLFAQYCNGTTTTCPGGLSQWGTVPLAEQGKSALEIDRSFYGQEVQLVTDAPVSENLGGSWPGITYRLGDAAEEVRTIQRRLNRVATNYPTIPKIYPVSGIFDKTTEDAVRAFQRQFELTPDGLVGKATWYRLAYLYNTVKRLSELDSEGLTLNDISREFPETLSLGMSNVYVELLQFLLSIVSAYYDDLPRLEVSEIDGTFGPRTEQAVRDYQQLIGLPQTGIVDLTTWNELISTYESVLAVQPLASWLPAAAPLALPSDLFLVEGVSGSEVTRLQEAINIIAREQGDIQPLAVDGVFGPATRAAVLVLQKQFGLPQTGAVGPLTWSRTITLSNEILAGSQTSEGQYPGYVVGEGMENV